MIRKTLDSFDSEVMALISDLELVQVGSPSFREALALRAVSGCCTFEHEFELARQNELVYIMKGLNPRFRAFRKKQDELTAFRQLSLDI